MDFRHVAGIPRTAARAEKEGDLLNQANRLWAGPPFLTCWRRRQRGRGARKPSGSYATGVGLPARDDPHLKGRPRLETLRGRANPNAAYLTTGRPTPVA